MLLLLLAGVYSFRQKRRAERATERSNPFGKTTLVLFSRSQATFYNYTMRADFSLLNEWFFISKCSALGFECHKWESASVKGGKMVLLGRD